MKRVLVSMVAVMLALQGLAQTDTTKSDKVDTIHVGNFIIIQKDKDRKYSNDSTYKYDVFDDHNWNINLNFFGGHPRHSHSNLSTNWFIFDLGFANWRDKTAYGTAEANAFLHAGSGPEFTKSDLNLRTVKSTNFNIWVFMQKLNVTKHIVNLKYGLGLEMYNFRYDNNILYNKNPVYLYRSDAEFSKDKLYVGYLTAPFMLNINTTPDKRRGFSFSGGISAGYRIGSHTKTKGGGMGKNKLQGDFDLDPWRIAYIAELGIGPFRLYGSYSINALQQDAVVQYPYAVGLRFSNW